MQESVDGASPDSALGEAVATFVRRARSTIGATRGHGREMSRREFADLLGLTESMVVKLENPRPTTMSGPVEGSIRMLLAPGGQDLTPQPGPVTSASAREALGEMWGLGRPLSRAELARALGLSPEHGGAYLSRVERTGGQLSNHVMATIKLMLAGGVPPTMASIVKPGYPRGNRVAE